MAMNDFFNYNAFIQQMNSGLSIWGQPSTIYIPSSKIALGYEDNTVNDITNNIGVPNVGNSFSSFETKCFINFNPKKNVFYKFNYFPEEGAEPVMAVFESSSLIREGCYVRTASEQATSVWGDMIYKVEAVRDLGKYKTLARFYFLSPTSADDLRRSLNI